MKYLCRVLFFGACLAAGQTAAAPARLQQLTPVIQQQFGSTFTLSDKFANPLITADFDGDGVEDAVMIADSKDPLPDSYQYKYQVADPYNAFFGFGNPQQTAGMGRLDPRQSHDLLVIFGAGAEAWRAATPKAKFVLINVPFDEITVGRLLIKKNKPPIFVIKAVETQLNEAAVFWDVKKKRWRYEPFSTLN